MIPRFKPTLGTKELTAAFKLPDKDDIESFERVFAELMHQKYALAFPYGRTGLLLLLEALGLKDKEIICPAYTCVVVPHAIIYSGNTPVFIDCESDGFNMNLDLVEKAITKKTGAIIATSLFGYPVNLDRIDEIRKRYPHIHVIQDCAHSFAAEWKGKPVHRGGIAALFGLNISKLMTSIFGGMITTDDEGLYKKLKQIRDHRLKKPTLKKSLKRLLYFLTVYPTFWEPIYDIINKLERSGLLNRFAKYYDETVIDMPEGYLEGMCGIEARVGTANVERYETIINRRRATAKYYFDHLRNLMQGIRNKEHKVKSQVFEFFAQNPLTFILPPQVEGATYSHFVVQVHDREKCLQLAIRKNVQLGWIIEYNIPEMKAYGERRPAEYPVAATYARTTINLPVWGGVTLAEKIVKLLLI